MRMTNLSVRKVWKGANVSMNIRQFVKSIIFIGIFLFALVTVTYILRTNGDVKDRFSGFYAEKNETLDIVMIGSSPIFPFYSAPKLWGETGITMYPLSSNVQRPVAAKYLIEETEKTQSPSLYIFEMRMYTMNDEDLSDNMAYTRGVTDNMKYSLNRIKTIQAMVPETKDRLSFYFDIFNYHTNWRMLTLSSELKNWRYNKPSELKGFDIKDEVGPIKMPSSGGAEGKMAISEAQENNLRSLLNYLKEKELNALFIVSPYNETLEEQQMFNYITDAIETVGYSFINMNNYYDEIGIVFEEDYADYGSHTNVVGAEKCTNFLEKYLLENYEFKDKRGERGYESWDRAYGLWLEGLDEAKKTIEERILNEDYAVKAE